MAPTTPDTNQRTAGELLPLVGGAGNITSVAHCMTRLRLGVRDRARVQDDAVRAHPAVLGVVEDRDTYQIVLGPGRAARVTRWFEQLVEAAPVTVSATAPGTASGTVPVTADALAERGAALRADRTQRNATPFKRLLRRIAAVFVPLIPALIGCGLIAGLNGLLVNSGRLPGITPALGAMASAFLALLAVFVGINTAKEFGGTPVIGGAVAAVVVFPGVTEISAFGQRLSPGQGGVLGALGAALLATAIERWCRRWVPESVDVLLTPTLTILLTGLVTVYGLMFVAGEVSSAIGRGADLLLASTGAFAGLVLGGLFLPLVMLGLHQALIPLHTTLIDQQGYTVLLPVLAMAGAGQVGAAIAVFVRLRGNRTIRATIRSALPAGFVGVGEPLIYGVSLPLGRPFVTACVGGAAGGAFVGLFSMLGTKVGSTAIGPSGWALFPLVQGNRGFGVTVAVYGGGLVVGYLAGFLTTYFFGFTSQSLKELNTDPTPDPDPTPEPARA
ncbi:PTS transporter subunit EIIC [Streptomyces uncialis]|uniref:PTS transporter subunit EIIC n=1 Tax=Streptomyces uncialis TaxID=1048205 RepID=UPI002257D25B|nr:PTS transporter subunit EIIC [Streptomyces uncialis]MCX4660967.1 PTS transporter subunit EIIC [Streptomyces uncialis]